MNLGVFKKPKAFITIPEIIFSIVAFSVLASYRDKLTFKVVCNPTMITQSTAELLTTEESSTDKPPTDEPPTDEPPTDEPPTDKPPTDEPPTDEPPIDKTPIDKTPMYKPLMDKPLMDKPQMDKPQMDKPPTDESKTNSADTFREELSMAEPYKSGPLETINNTLEDGSNGDASGGENSRKTRVSYSQSNSLQFFVPDVRARLLNTQTNLLASNSSQDTLNPGRENSIKRAAQSGERLRINILATSEEEQKIIQCNITVQYPFKLTKLADEENDCTYCNGTKAHLDLNDTSSSMAIFFMFVGVTSFLFTLVMIPIYIYQEDIASQIAFFRKLDLILHAILLIFWFCASISWAVGVANLKYDTSESQIVALNGEEFECTDDLNACSAIPPSSYGGIVTSVVFGFINFILYGANLGFILKDDSLKS